MEDLFTNCIKHPSIDDRMHYLSSCFDKHATEFINHYSAFYLKPTIAYYRQRILEMMISYCEAYVAMGTNKPEYLDNVSF